MVKAYHDLYFPSATPDILMQVIYWAYTSDTRIKVIYANGVSDEGYIGKVNNKTGAPNVTIVNRKSMESGTYLHTDRIIAIQYANKREGGLIWRR